MDSVARVLTSLVTSLPVYVVWLVGVVFALLKMRSHATTSWLLLSGLALHFVVGIVSRVVFTDLPRRLIDAGQSASDVGVALTVVSAVTNVFVAAAWALVIAAVFRDRAAAPHDHGYAENERSRRS